ncbi:hypothetical protein GCM10023340_00190 [Nocardioides marinquilinus]|uniref:DUF2975 domain-containing protein n=2 Tax=Nocardioides marinquilinus TaxID=1210400 RepID=A0ABP9P478_9ACTN
MERTDAQRLADRAEGAARGFAVLAGVVLCLALPMAWVERLEDGVRSDEYLSTWGALIALLSDQSGVGENLVALIGVVVLALGIAGAAYVALSWLTAGVEYDGVSRYLRNGSMVLLLAGAGLLALGAGIMEPVGPGDEPSTGLGLGAGLWAVLFLALALTAPRLVLPRD